MRWFWLDRFTEFRCGERATALKGVTLSEDYLHDHWDCYPVMPNSLIAEGMAQTSGLLVSEAYQFSELVVLAKFAKCAFDGEVRPGDTITFRAVIEQIKDAGASVTVKADVGERQHGQAEIFFARMDSNAAGQGSNTKLFNPEDLLKWLRLVGVFDVGVRADGSRLRPEDYDFDN